MEGNAKGTKRITRENSPPTQLDLSGRTIHPSGEPYEIAGVAAPGLTDPFIGDVDVWLPHNIRGKRDSLGSVVARIKSPATLEPGSSDSL